MLFYGVFGVIVGGPPGLRPVLQSPYYALASARDLRGVAGGMSFTAASWACSSLAIFARAVRKRWLEVTDFIGAAVPLGLAAGRLGNFINGELVGTRHRRAVGDGVPRRSTTCRGHPSQLYQFAGEGGAVPSSRGYAASPRPPGAVSGLFLDRLRVPLPRRAAREPDAFLGSRRRLHDGPVLSMPMIAVASHDGWAYRRAGKAQPTVIDRMKPRPGVRTFADDVSAASRLCGRNLQPAEWALVLRWGIGNLASTSSP